MSDLNEITARLHALAAAANIVQSLHMANGDVAAENDLVAEATAACVNELRGFERSETAAS